MKSPSPPGAQRRRARRLGQLAVISLLVASACGDEGGANDTASISVTTAPAAATTAAPTGSFTSVRFETADGLGLEGRVYEAGSSWVILGHMLPATQASWFEFAAAAQEAGFTALTYNTRGKGDSDGPAGDHDVGTDALAAIDFAGAEGASTIVYIGASMNGAAALHAGATTDLAGVASLSGVQRFAGADAFRSAPNVAEPKLFVAADDDGQAVRDAQALFDASPHPKDLQVFERGGHGTDMFTVNDGLTQMLLDFIARVSG